MGVWPTSRVWDTYQWPCPQKQWLSLLQQLLTTNSVSVGGGPWPSSTPSRLGFWPAWASEGNHSHCEHLSTEATSCPKDSTWQHTSCLFLSFHSSAISLSFSGSRINISVFFGAVQSIFYSPHWMLWEDCALASICCKKKLLWPRWRAAQVYEA